MAATEVKKNITVVARVRPPVEGDDGGAESLSVQGNRAVLMEKGQARSFELDAVYDRSASNAALFEAQVEPLLQRALAGYHTCVVVYGAGRTGKTFTLSGSGGGSDGGGLLAQSAEVLFQRLESLSGSSRAFVSLSAFDVYNGSVIDLLQPNSKSGLSLVEHRALGCVVDGAAELECSSGAELKALMRQALAVHDALELRITNQLGKPHTFIDIRVELQDKDSPSTVRVGSLRFCSAAGSGGVALKFNQGLQALSRVADALAADKDAWQVPYAVSRLTRLLEANLGGNCLTLWLTTLDAGERSAADSAHALELADKIRRVRNSARVNRNTVAATVRELRDEIKKARGRLQLTQPGSYMHDLDPAAIRSLKQLVAELERVKASTWERRRARSVELQTQRRAALEAEGLLYTLADATDVELPDAMRQSARALLQAIVAQKALCDDSEAEAGEKRNLFKMRVESVQKRALASAPDAAQPPPPQSLAELVKGDDKLAKLERGLAESEDKLRANQAELAKLEDEYRKLLGKMATIEAKQRKLLLMGRDAAGLERLNKANEWATMRKEIEQDPKIADITQRIQHNTEAQKQAILASSDVQQLRDAAMQTLESLRETTENSARLEWERDALWGRLIESQFKHEVQMTRYQEHMFFIFRNYRSHFEEQKDRMDARYRDLLENAVKDALKLSEENQKLRAQLDARLKQI